MRVLYGEFRLVPSQTMFVFHRCAELYDWLSDGEMSGRYVFDLGVCGDRRLSRRPDPVMTRPPSATCVA